MSLTFKKQTAKLTKKTKDEEVEKSRLALEIKTLEELEVLKLNSISMIAFLEEDKKNLMNKRFNFKEKYGSPYSYTKLESSVSTFKSDLDKPNLSIQHMISV